ncbi:MAG TPA: ArsR family transcriptional regulator [Candidatus Woesebacteria bacterium]|nr:ArsR family transcriptional regulator [Candidatus Woesebacteria bacterium]
MDTTSIDSLISQFNAEEDAVNRAKIVYFLHREKVLSLKEIANLVKLHPTYISHYLRILDLPPLVLDGYYAKQISSAHLFILSRLKNKEDMQKAYETILANNLTSAQAEELVRAIKFSVSTTHKQLHPNEIEKIVKEIQKIFPEMNIKIVQTKVKGKFVLELKGDTTKTSAFIKEVADKLSHTAYSDVQDDELYILE